MVLLIESQVSSFTWRNGSADRWGGEGGEQSVYSVTEVLREEHMSVRRAARQFTELFPSYERKTRHDLAAIMHFKKHYSSKVFTI